MSGKANEMATERSGVTNGSEPRLDSELVVFSCAGAGGLSTPALEKVRRGRQVRHISVPCSGKLQPEHLLKALEQGADEVLISTCSSGDCPYLEGNHRVRRRAEYVNNLLNEIGLGRNCIKILPSSEGDGVGALAELERTDFTANGKAKTSERRCDDGLD